MDRIGSSTVRKIFLDNSYHMVTMDNERELVAWETHKFFLENIAVGSASVRNHLSAADLRRRASAAAKRRRQRRELMDRSAGLLGS